MAQLDRMKELRFQVLQDAAERWNQRSEKRAGAKVTVAALGSGAADSAARQDRYKRRETKLLEASALQKRGELPLFIERKIGPTLDYLSAAPSEAARKAGRSVARIVTSADPRVQPEGEATGFLVAPSLLLTNWHVFPEKGAARGTGANFLYERNEKGIAIGITFEIDPDAFYLSNKELDYCFVGMKSRAVDGSASDNLGTIALIEATPKILIGQKVNIIEHPEGREKQYAYKNNRLLDILDQGFLHYETDTLEGSSGSPAFSEMWELVGLHHAGIPEIRDGRIIAEGGDPWNEDMGQDKVHWIANEGIRVSAIVQSLASVTLTDLSQAKILAELLASTSDPVEDIAKHLAGTSGQSGDVSQPRLDIVERLRPSGSAIGGDRVMGGHQFNFSGPVTINVYAPTAPATPAPIAAALATPAAMEKAIRFDRDYDDREGYSPDFLEPGTAALSVPPPGVSAARAGELLSGDDGAVLELKYHHFTIVMNKARRLQMWSAVNVDYDDTRRSQSGRASFGTDKWVPDPRIPERAQIFDSEIYAPAGQIDRGHIVRREDNAWGDSDKEVEFANSDTFHWTNCTPQHQAFNRESAGAKYGRKGLWGDFEQYIQKSLQQGDTKACVIAGPILAADDPKADFGLGPVQYPIKFWKIVAVAVPGAQGGKELQVFGFVLSQKDVVDDFGIEAFRPGRFAQYQVSLPEITDLTGVTFAQMLHDADTKAPAEA